MSTDSTPAVPDTEKSWTDLISKKMTAGPVSATALLLSHSISGWQWVTVTVAWLIVQGAVDWLIQKNK